MPPHAAIGKRWKKQPYIGKEKYNHEKAEGTVSLTNASDRSMTIRENMRLYNGYHAETKTSSYAWINLDSAKLAKMDASSKVDVRKHGKKLELLLDKSNLFFNVTNPLKADETLNIHTSAMAIGIRGTCGWVKALDAYTTEIYVLEATVQCIVSGLVTGQTKSVTLNGGDMATMSAHPNQTGDKCEISQEKFAVSDIDGFVMEELEQDPGLCDNIYRDSGLDILGTADEEGNGQNYQPDNADDLLETLRNAKGGDVITLSRDIEAKGMGFIYIDGGSEADPVVFDLNGHTMTTDRLIVRGTLWIRDSSSTGSGTMGMAENFV